MPINIAYARPTSLDEATSTLAEYGNDAAVLSGGQSLLPTLRQRSENYDALIDINGIDGYEYIERRDETVTIGFLTRHAAVAESELVLAHCPVLAEAMKSVGDVQVRNRGTLCGAIAQADPSGDPPVVACALDAEIVSTDHDETNRYSAASFFVGPGETALDETEIVTVVCFPVVSSPRGAGYARYTGASDQAYPVSTVAAVIELNDGRIANARVVTGAVERQPVMMSGAAEHLTGREPTEEVLTDAASRVGERADPVAGPNGSPEFKSEVTKAIAKDALESAIERAGGGPA